MMKILSYFKKFNGVVWIQAAGGGLTAFVNSLLLPFLSLYLYEKIGHNLVLVMLVVGLQPFTELVLTFVASGWPDRFGRRPVLIGSIALQAAAVAGMALSSHLFLLAVFVILNGLARFFYIPTARAQITDSTPVADRSEVFALLSTCNSIGTVFGPAVGALLFMVDHRLVFLFAAVNLFIYLILLIRSLPESAPVQQETAPAPPFRIWREKWLLLFILGMLPIGLIHAEMETNWPIILKSRVENYLFLFSFLETVGTLCYLFFELWVVKVSGRFRKSVVVGTGYAAYALAALGFAFSGQLVLLTVSEVLLCVGGMLVLNHSQHLISLIAPPGERARYFAFGGLHWDIARAFGPLLGGTLLTGLGGASLFIICAGLLLIGGWHQTRLFEKQTVFVEKRRIKI